MIEKTILDLLQKRDPGKTICPSEAARALAPEDWRPLMPVVREAAAQLADAGRVQVTQQGQVVDGRTVHGPVRVGLVGAAVHPISGP